MREPQGACKKLLAF